MSVLKLKRKPQIIKFQTMPDNPEYQGAILGLADDGKIYISHYATNLGKWTLYIDDEFHNEEYTE